MKKKYLQIIFMFILTILNYEFLFSNSRFISSLFELKIDFSLYVFSYARFFLYALFGLILYLISPYLVERKINSKKNKVIDYLMFLIMIMLTLLTLALCLIFRINIISLSIIFFVYIYLIFIYLFYSNSFKLNILLICSVTFIYGLVSDTFHPIDEKIHFYSSYNIAIGNFDFKENYRNNDLDKIMMLGNFNETENLQIKYNHQNYEVEEEDLYPLSKSSKYLYFPSALGIFISNTLDGTIMDTYYIGRIFNSLFFLVGVAFLLKIIPFKLNTFVAILCTPYLLLLSGTYSVDGLGNISMMLFIAYILKIVNDKDIKFLNKKNLGLLILFSILILSYKSGGYFFIFGLLFLLYKKVPKKFKWLYFLSFILILFIVYRQAMPTDLDTGDIRGGNTNMKDQLAFLFSGPIKFLLVYGLHTLNTFFNFDFYTGLNDQYFFSKLSSYFTMFYMLYLCYMSFNFEKEQLKFKSKIVLFLSACLIFYFTSTGLYLSYTPVGSYFINGYQCRYTWIIILLLLLCFNNKFFKSFSTKYINPLTLTLTLNVLYLCLAVFSRIIKFVI